MKLPGSYENVSTVANSWKNAVNPVAVGIFNPAYGREWDRGLLLDSTALQPWPSVAVAVLWRPVDAVAQPLQPLDLA